MSKSTKKREYWGPGGGPPPAKSRNDSKKFEQHPFHLYEEFDSGVKRIKTFFIFPGNKTSVVTLDKGDLGYNLLLHSRFWFEGSYDNYAACRNHVDSKGCPLCDQIGDPTWFMVSTCIDRTEFIPDEGRNKGVVYKDNRRIMLITRGKVPSFEQMSDELEEDGGVGGDYRGYQLRVRRDAPIKSKDGRDQIKSPRIGSAHIPTRRLSEERMLEEFEVTAVRKGITPEEYIQSADYNKLFAPYSYEAMLELAEDLKGHEAPPSKWDKKPTSKPKPRRAVAEEEEIPF